MRTIAGVLLVLVFFGVPLIMAFFVRRLLKRDLLRDPKIKQAYGSIYDSYKDQCVDFECYSLLRRGLSVVFVVIAERQEQDAAIFEAGSQILVTALYLYIVITWRPFVSAPAKYTVCKKRFTFDVYNDFEQFGVYTQLAVQRP